jgi:hypothetical protein
MVPAGTRQNPPPSTARTAIVSWAAGLGAVTAEALGLHLQISVPSARGRQH